MLTVAFTLFTAIIPRTHPQSFALTAPFTSTAETGTVQQQNNLDVDAYNRAAGQPEETNQQTLIDRSKIPESVDALGGPNAQANDKAETAVDEPNSTTRAPFQRDHIIHSNAFRG